MSPRRCASVSIASANSFFSLPYSSSRDFRRLASDTSRPPYLAFHLKNVALLIPYLPQTSAVLGLLLAQDPDDLLFCEPARLHVHPLPGDGL
jgi:hypothetical protein